MKEVRITNAGLYEFTGDTRVVADADFVLSDSYIKVIDGSLEINCAVGSNCRFEWKHAKPPIQQFNDVSVAKGSDVYFGDIHIVVGDDGRMGCEDISKILSNSAAPHSIVFREVVGDFNSINTNGAAVVLEKSAGDGLFVSSMGGSVLLKEPAGDSLIVMSMSGDIILSDIGADCIVQSTGAQIKAGHVGHRAMLNANGGPITVISKGNEAILKSFDGEIRVLAEEAAASNVSVNKASPKIGL